VRGVRLLPPPMPIRWTEPEDCPHPADDQTVVPVLGMTVGWCAWCGCIELLDWPAP
jgi:hypothetical protein